MMFKITYSQLRNFLLISIALLVTWIIMGHYARFNIVDSSQGQVIVKISFLSPMNQEGTIKQLTITSEIPNKKVTYHSEWISSNTLQITIDESEYPRGLEYTIYFKKAPAMVPPFTVSVHKKINLTLAPRLIALEPKENIPTEGPLVLIFNTPVNPESFQNNVTTTAPGLFTPQMVLTEQSDTGYDFSRWVLTPEKRFENSKKYEINISDGLQGKGGGIVEEAANIIFTTAPPLEITEIYPQPYSPSIWLNRNITVKASHPIREAKVEVEGIPGSVSIEGNNVHFKPEEIYLPSKKYTVNIHLKSVDGEKTVKNFWFGTTNLGNQRWIGIQLGNPSSVRVFEGNQLLQSFQGWVSIPEDKIPKVTMYEENRGSTLEYNPQEKSPIRYIRLNADIMIHHLHTGQNDNHNLIGISPSYGCILLNKQDFDWIYEHVPAKVMVIMH